MARLKFLLPLAAVIAGPAHAAECLQQIDGMTVEFALPPSEGMLMSPENSTATSAAAASAATKGPVSKSAATKGAAGPAQPDLGQPGLGQPGLGQPGSAAATSAGRARAGRPIADAAAAGLLPQVVTAQITADQRTRLQHLLQQARVAEAVGNETQCADLLRQAQDVVK